MATKSPNNSALSVCTNSKYQRTTIHRIPDYLAQRIVRNPRETRSGFDKLERSQTEPCLRQIRPLHDRHRRRKHTRHAKQLASGFETRPTRKHIQHSSHSTRHDQTVVVALPRNRTRMPSNASRSPKSTSTCPRPRRPSLIFTVAASRSDNSSSSRRVSRPPS